VLVLLTRPLGHHKRVSSLVERLIVTRPLRRLSPDLATRFERRGEPYSRCSLPLMKPQSGRPIDRPGPSSGRR